MIYRDKRNIGKLARVRVPGSLFDGFTGRITEFRGTKTPRVPARTVWHPDGTDIPTPGRKEVPWVVIRGYTFGGDFVDAISTEEERQ
jgi:hypothetical protein